MRPSLRPRTDRRRPGGASNPRRSSPGPHPRGAELPLRPLTPPVESSLRGDLLGPDRDLSRARRAGGPEDVAHYACACGYVFEAMVSTTVACPHCGSGQAW